MNEHLYSEIEKQNKTLLRLANELLDKTTVCQTENVAETLTDLTKSAEELKAMEAYINTMSDTAKQLYYTGDVNGKHKMLFYIIEGLIRKAEQ